MPTANELPADQHEGRPVPPREQVLLLSADEVMVLSDRLRSPMLTLTGDAVLSLLLKLGSLYVELLGSGVKRTGQAPISVTEAEAWLLRDLLTSMDRLESSPKLGIELITKLYRVLIACNTEPIDLPDAEGAARELKADDRAALMRWGERYRPKEG